MEILNIYLSSIFSKRSDVCVKTFLTAIASYMWFSFPYLLAELI